MRRDSTETDEGGVDWDSDPGGGQLDGSRFQVVEIAVRRPFRYAVPDGTGAIRDVFRSRWSAEHAARMLAPGAGYGPHAVLGARVSPPCASLGDEYGSGPCAANHVLSGEA